VYFAVSADNDGRFCHSGVVRKSDRQPAANISYWLVYQFSVQIPHILASQVTTEDIVMPLLGADVTFLLLLLVNVTISFKNKSPFVQSLQLKLLSICSRFL